MSLFRLVVAHHFRIKLQHLIPSLPLPAGVWDWSEWKSKINWTEDALWWCSQFTAPLNSKGAYIIVYLNINFSRFVWNAQRGINTNPIICFFPRAAVPNKLRFFYRPYHLSFRDKSTKIRLHSVFSFRWLTKCLPFPFQLVSRWSGFCLTKKKGTLVSSIVIQLNSPALLYALIFAITINVFLTKFKPVFKKPFHPEPITKYRNWRFQRIMGGVRLHRDLTGTTLSRPVTLLFPV